MGTSTDAILFYGYVWTEEGATPERLLARGEPDYDEDDEDVDEDSREWPEILLAKRGMENPYKDYPSDDEMTAIGRAATTEQAEAYYADYGYHRPKGPNDDYAYRQLGFHLWRNTPERKAQMEAWYAAQKAVRAEFGVDISSHCSGDYPMAYIHVVGERTFDWPHLHVSRGDAKAVDLEAMTSAPYDEWNTKLARFIEEFNIDLSEPEYGEPPQGPGWFVVSNWSY